MTALRGLAVLLILQLAGEALAHALAWPIPGPVVGMALLLAALGLPVLRGPVQAAAEGLLQHLSLLFIPVGVGVITHMDLMSSHGVQLVVVIVLSTVVGLAVTALVLQQLWPAEAGSALSDKRHELQ
jgi:holin-like protein